MTPLELAEDLPRWVEARAMLLAGEEAIPDGRGFLVTDGRLAVLLGDARSEPRDAETVLIAIEREEVARGFEQRGWLVERALLHTLPDPDALPEDEGASELPPDADLSHLPEPLAAELRRAAQVHAAWVDGLPVSFAYAPWRTERWFDVSVDTVASARQLGLATRVAAAMIRAEREAGREPVWGAGEDNLASLRLAARLGFVACDALWVLTRAKGA